ncbi:hypothetical protein [Cellulomonas xiejunii]|uniref:Glycosyltransferase RgtA/B/C/D-like domain-containing protein n=1 Tax=Cellulomonas xiejunii TaxID=2968083 RepID=A0ABY5KJ46_9CELL|nr:hypothetical protein [Cellulomonas xiejunii]MCC2312940.1 hypothetical protein [Cellulomonas xiejunii]MCC2320190.1 hypothetical protein [Cellulomonas xiejunii]UUI70497.1 hypothetical protein NP048_11855 [Cellulomonas xiejunii]
MLDLSAARPGTAPRGTLRVLAPAPPRRTVVDRSVALGAGALAATGVVALRGAGLLEGWAALAVTVVVVLALPTSRLGARRLLLAAGLTAGLVPALWWVDLPLGTVGRAGALLACVTGAVVTIATWQGPTRVAARTRDLLLPQWRSVDLLIAATAGLAVVTTRGLLAVRTGPEALARLLPAWDSSAHADMVLMLRRHGAVMPALGAAPSGETWKFADYPQGYHAVVATLVELMAPAIRPTGEELVLFVHAHAVALGAAAVILVAGLCALPTATRRPVALTLSAAGVAGVFLLGPGAYAAAAGFPNLVLAAAAAGAAVLLAFTVPRVTLPLPMAAACGLLVGVAQSWALLCVVAVPAVALVVMGRGRSAWRGTPARWAAVAMVAVATCAGALQTAATLRSLDATEVLVIPGGIAIPHAGLALAIIAGAVALCLAPGGNRRLPAVAGVVMVGVVSAAAVGALQLLTAGELSYYFWKLVLGLAMMSSVALAAAAVLRGPAAAPVVRPRRDRLRTAGAVAIGCVALLQVHGVLGRATGAYPADPALVATAADLIAASDAAATAAAPAVFLQASPTLHPVNAQQWFLALTGTWTTGTEADASVLMGTSTPDEVARTVTERGWLVVVAPQDVPAVVADLVDDAAVVSW